MKQPCERNCSERAPGCAVSCPKWAEYAKARDEEYRRRDAERLVNDVVHDGIVRCQAK